MGCYVKLEYNGCRVVALDWAVPAIREALGNRTLHDWAAAQEGGDPMRGRGISYGVLLPATPLMPSATPVVVRRNRHGGLLRFLTGEYFLMPTRAPQELAIARRLAAAGIPTPEVVAYAVYPFAGIFARSDVMTRRLPEGTDFPAAWSGADGSAREAMLSGVAGLLRALARAGAWHADLNLKNIYIAGHGPDLTAYVLDVDRVSFPGGRDIAARNLARLARSARKWRERWGLDFDEETLARLSALVLEKI